MSVTYKQRTDLLSTDWLRRFGHPLQRMTPIADDRYKRGFSQTTDRHHPDLRVTY